MNQLVGAELIGIVLMAASPAFRLDTFPEVGAPGSLFRWPNSIAPIITVRKTSAREPHDRSFDLSHLVDQLFANPVGVRNGRTLADPNTVVNYATQIFGKMAIQVTCMAILPKIWV